jgi:hypothetical protein
MDCGECILPIQRQELIDADIDDDETLRIPDSEYTGPKFEEYLRDSGVHKNSPR